MLKEYTHKGYRVIACAYKEVPQDAHIESTALKREQVESQLQFIGFVVLLNKLKPQTKPVIEELNATNIRSIMVTGDNALTAVTVAKSCSIIPSEKKVYLSILESMQLVVILKLIGTSDNSEKVLKWMDVNTDESVSSDVIMSQYGEKKLFELAITGDVFDYILAMPNNTGLVHKMLLHCDIFARMAPNNKMRLVEELMKLDYYVGMVGDGSNDVCKFFLRVTYFIGQRIKSSTYWYFAFRSRSIHCCSIHKSKSKHCLRANCH